MQHTKEEILNALQIIQDTCKEHTCGNCPFRNDFDVDDNCSIQNRSPDSWSLNTPTNWKAFN